MADATQASLNTESSPDKLSSDATRRHPRWRSAILVFCIVLAVRLTIILLCALGVDVPGLGSIIRPIEISGGDARDYDAMATNFLAGRGLVENTGAATRQPLFPAMLAALYAVFGRSATPLVVVHACLGAITAVVCWRLVADRFPASVAFAGAVLAGIEPEGLRFMVRIRQEPLMTLLVALSVLAHVYAGRKNVGWRTTLAGASVALAYLCRTPFLVFAAFGLWWLFWRRTETWLSRFRTAGWYALGVLVLMTPWLTRNLWLTGHTNALTSRAGAFFWGGNNPYAKTVWEDPPRWGHFGAGRELGREFKLRWMKEHKASEDDYGRWIEREAKTYLRKHPWRFVELFVSRTIVLWQIWPTPPPPVFFFVPIWLAYALAIVGTVIGWKRFPEVRLFIGVVATFTIVHGVSHAIPRYKASAMPYIWLLCAYGAFQIYLMVHRKLRQRGPCEDLAQAPVSYGRGREL